MTSDPQTLFAALDETAREGGFSGVVSVDVAGEQVHVAGYGLADRRHQVPVRPGTRFAMASGSKAFTALVVQCLVEDGTLSLDTTARSLLGADLPLVDDAATVRHLLEHTSGIGDYLDEESLGDITDVVLRTPVHRLEETEAFVAELDGYPQVSPPGERFAYNNGGYVLLALLAQRAGGLPFHDLVQQRVLDPAGLTSTGFPRSDELPADVATGYLHERGSDRTNVLHLPVRGNGDGGACTTAADLSLFWRAFLEGRIVSGAAVAEMARPRVTVEDEGLRYGRGFWLDLDGPGLVLEGYDAGASMRTRVDPGSGLVVSILSNTSEGAWPVISRLQDELG